MILPMVRGLSPPSTKLKCNELRGKVRPRPEPFGLAPDPERGLLAAMLAAEKAQLRSSVAVEQLMLRDKELHYYLNTMSSVSTQVQSTGPCSWSQTEYIDDLSISASASATASASAAASAATVGRQATVAVRHWRHANACQCPQCPQCTKFSKFTQNSKFHQRSQCPIIQQIQW